MEAMDFFELKEGIIVTFDQQDEFQLNDKIIKVIPAHVYLTFTLGNWRTEFTEVQLLNSTTDN